MLIHPARPRQMAFQRLLGTSGISDRIAVMLQGEIVELAPAAQIYAEARHPFTQKLLGSFPSLSGERGAFIRTGIDEQRRAQ